MLSSARMKGILPLATLLAGLVASPAGAEVCVVWIEFPGARFAHANTLATAGLLPWLRASFEEGCAGPVSGGDRALVTEVRRRLAATGSKVVDAGVGVEPIAETTVIRIDRSLRSAPAWMEGAERPSAELAESWSGSTPWAELRRIAGLDGALRWEEVEEFLSLGPRENRSLIALPFTPSHPLWRIRRGYEADKLFTNAAIYFGIASGSDRVFLRLELVELFENDLIPWTDGQLDGAADDPPGAGPDRAFFMRRLRSSDGRVYARCDRIIQSIQQEWSGEVWIVVDASESPDPFLAVRCPGEEGPPLERLARLRDALPAQAGRPR